MTQTVEEVRARAAVWVLDKRRTVVTLAVIGAVALIKPQLFTVFIAFLQDAVDAIFSW